MKVILYLIFWSIALGRLVVNPYRSGWWVLSLKPVHIFHVELLALVLTEPFS